MKRMLIFALLVVCAALFAADKSPQKFNVTFTITYNELTLDQAAELEKEVLKQHAKACEIGVGVNNIQRIHNTYSFTDTVQIAPRYYRQGILNGWGTLDNNLGVGK